MKIVFMGTPDFAKASLEAIVEAGYEVIGVVTNVDKPKGRGMKLIPSEVKQYAMEKNLKIYQPFKVRNNEEFLTEMRSLNPDLVVVVAYGKILPKELLEIPKLGCVNVHGSLLPKYRGAAPIQWAVLNGETETGITTMYMNEGMDTGDMIETAKVEIGPDETTGELWDRLAKIGASLLVQTLQKIENGTAQRIKQNDEEASYAPMLDKEMAKINWKEQDTKTIHNRVRGLNPIMGAYTFLNGQKIKFWKVKAKTTEEFFTEFTEWDEYQYKLKEIEPGTILKSDPKDGLYIKAKDGILQVLEIQGENAKKMDVGSFLRGRPISAGECFG